MGKLGMYETVGKYSEALGASSEKQIELLIAKAKKDVQGAIAAIEQQDIVTKCNLIGNANHIIEYLQTCVRVDLAGDAEQDLAQRLSSSFKYLEQQFLKANINSAIQKLNAGDKSSIKILQECEKILTNIQVWWEKVLELQ
jgi:flagellin-specific chaperone FliS